MKLPLRRQDFFSQIAILACTVSCRTSYLALRVIYPYNSGLSSNMSPVYIANPEPLCRVSKNIHWKGIVLVPPRRHIHLPRPATAPHFGCSARPGSSIATVRDNLRHNSQHRIAPLSSKPGVAQALWQSYVKQNPANICQRRKLSEGNYISLNYRNPKMSQLVHYSTACSNVVAILY